MTCFSQVLKDKADLYRYVGFFFPPRCLHVNIEMNHLFFDTDIYR